ncbi:MAG: hypothetical protein F6K16_28935 [Symploca sp. SIO2B6]|nr:hypothetical protein [Symploca sp. SIO2B6]
MLHFLGVAVLAIYAGGVWKFWTGFNRTNFSSGRWYLGALWPVLLINASYRQNFNKVLKGR